MSARIYNLFRGSERRARSAIIRAKIWKNILRNINSWMKSNIHPKIAAIIAIWDRTGKWAGIFNWRNNDSRNEFGIRDGKRGPGRWEFAPVEFGKGVSIPLDCCPENGKFETS